MEQDSERNPVTLFIIYMSVIAMSRVTVTLLMNWQITFSTDGFTYVRTKDEKQNLTFHLKMLKFTTFPSQWRSCRMLYVEPMVLCLNKLQQWATDNSFRFSKTKTGIQKRCLHLDPQLFMDNSPIPIVSRPNFWGLYLTGRYPLYFILNMLKRRAWKILAILNGELTERSCPAFIDISLDLN